jgi:transcriptional regulator with XRE-family HTH domain
LGISQEKLAEFAGLSVQMINSIEGCRAWVSDKTLVTLANVLGLEVYQLFIPAMEEETAGEKDRRFAELLTRLRQEIKADIDTRITRLIRVDTPKRIS